MAERFQINITPEDQGLKIKELLKRRLGLSSRLLRKLKQEDAVFLNGESIKMFERGKAGDCITLSLPEETSGFIPEPIPIEVIYEDEDLLVINKQPGYVVHPTKGHPSHTIANGVMNYMMAKGDSYKIRFINRLDMDTTGLLLIGKNSHCQDDFARQAAAGCVEKRYVALVKGYLSLNEGTIDLPIGKPIDDQVKRAVIPEGYPSITHFRVIERYKKPYTLVELLLETGRTHQIRVHMAHMGHPVVGDALYGTDDIWMIERQALHAVRLDFNHPVTGARLSLKAPIPSDMFTLMGKL